MIKIYTDQFFSGWSNLLSSNFFKAIKIPFNADSSVDNHAFAPCRGILKYQNVTCDTDLRNPITVRVIDILMASWLIF